MCDPNTCGVLSSRRKELELFLKSVEPCDGFKHKHSCGVDCLHYRNIIIGGQKWHYCRNKRINLHALKFINQVGCYTFERDLIGSN
jgi:hypothetical protein